MKNIKQNHKAIELHNTCMQSVEALIKAGYDNDVAYDIITAFIKCQCNYDIDLLIAAIKIQFLDKSIESVGNEIISKIMD